MMNGISETLINCLNNLPKPLVGTMCHDLKEKPNLRNSCIEMYKEVIEISKPKEILEIGTHGGHSSALWLEYSQANVTSVDIGYNWITMDYSFSDWGIPGGPGLNHVIKVLNHFYSNRFRFIQGDSTSRVTIKKYSDKKYDLIFIDGNHDFDYVYEDIKTALELSIPYLLLDDYTGEEDGAVVAAKKHSLTLIKKYDNIHNINNLGCALFKNPLLNE